MKTKTNTLPKGDSADKIIDSQGSFTLFYTFCLLFAHSLARIQSKEYNHVFAHAKDFGFCTGSREFKSVCIVHNQLWLGPKTSQNQRLVIHGSG